MNYENYFNEYRSAFGILKVCNDEMLGPLSDTTIRMQKRCYFVLMPVTGELEVRVNYGEPCRADVGQVQISSHLPNDTVTLTNTYDGDWISYLYFCIELHDNPTFTSHTVEFDLQNEQNELIAIFDATRQQLPFTMQIGCFDGRHEATYKLANDESCVFAFVVAGAFEIQGRLLHQRDGLALWNLQEVEVEALSNNAIMMLLSW